MAYKDSDSTVVITSTQWPKHTILAQEIIFVVDLCVFLFSGQLPLFERSLWHSLAVQLSGKANKDSEYTTMIAQTGIHRLRVRPTTWSAASIHNVNLHKYLS